MFLRRLSSVITAISVAVILAVIAASLSSCTTASLSNGKDTVTYKGAKVFSPTVLSLRSGNCAVPAVDGNGVVTQPPLETKTSVNGTATVTEPSDACHTEVMQVNGVDVKGLTSTIMAAVLSAMASIATGA